MDKKVTVKPKKVVLSERVKALNQKIGGFKRKLKISAKDKVGPGDLINKSRALGSKKLAIKGLV